MFDPLPFPWEPSPEAGPPLPAGSSHREGLSVKWLEGKRGGEGGGVTGVLRCAGLAFCVNACVCVYVSVRIMSVLT